MEKTIKPLSTIIEVKPNTFIFEKNSPGRLLLMDLKSEDLSIKIVLPPIIEQKLRR